jgi:hypothetical protein
MKCFQRTAVIVFALATIAGCASVPMAPPDQDLRMKSMMPPPNMALVYVYRNESMGAAVKMPILIDGTWIGESVAKSYAIWQVAPGPHEVVSKAENDSKMPFFAQPGRAYFFWQEVKMGFAMARTELHAVPDAQGRAGVNECHLIAPPTNPQSAPVAAPAPAPNYYAQPPAQGYAQPAPQGYAQPAPQGYAQPAPQGYAQPPPQGYAPPAGYAQPPPQGYTQP